jgi:heme exporter protein A
MQPCRITARDLACRRGDRLLFRGLSLGLGAGDALRVTGGNGVGKTSLLRILAGLLSPVNGSVESEGTIGLVNEQPALDPHLPLGAALGFWRQIDAAGARDHLDRLGLGELLDVPVRYLSTGQRKRAALVRLIGQAAPVWLLDEPLNGLDVDAARLVETIAAEHCASGGLCVIASHQPFASPSMQQLALADFAI